jgi:hypothetical protein
MVYALSDAHQGAQKAKKANEKRQGEADKEDVL